MIHSTPDFKVGNRSYTPRTSTIMAQFYWCIWSSGKTINLPYGTMNGIDSLDTNIPKKRRWSTCETWW